MSEKDKPVIVTENKQETADEAKVRILARRRNMQSRGKLYLSPEDRDPNYVYRFVNHSNEYSNVQDKMELGYEIVRDKTLTGNDGISDKSGLGSAVTKQVGRGMTGVLMRVRRDIYEEGQKIKDQMTAKTEDGIRNPQGLNRETTFTKSIDNSID